MTDEVPHAICIGGCADGQWVPVMGSFLTIIDHDAKAAHTYNLTRVNEYNNLHFYLCDKLSQSDAFARLIKFYAPQRSH